MKNKKGFTLVELLATISILAIISIIAVPSVINLTNKNEKNTYVNDAKRFITLSEYAYRSNQKNPISMDDITSFERISPNGEYTSGTAQKQKDGNFCVCLTDGTRCVYGNSKMLSADDAVKYVKDGCNCSSMDYTNCKL